MACITKDTMSPLEKRLTYRSLLCLAKSLELMRVTIDLRNETSVSGKIIFVDGFGNVSMEDAAYVDNEDGFKYFAQLHIPCRMIRDFIIPDEVSISDSIKSFTLKQRREPKPKNQGRTFKQKRAMLMQEESKRLVAEIQAKKWDSSFNYEP